MANLFTTPRFPPTLADCIEAAGLMHSLENLKGDLAVKTSPTFASIKATLNTTTLVENGDFKYQPQEASDHADDEFSDIMDWYGGQTCDKNVKTESRASTPAVPAPGIKQETPYKFVPYNPAQQTKPTRGMNQPTRRSPKAPSGRVRTGTTPVDSTSIKSDPDSPAFASKPGPAARGQAKPQKAPLAQSAYCPDGYVPAQDNLTAFAAAANPAPAPRGQAKAQKAPLAQSAYCPDGYVPAQDNLTAFTSAANPAPAPRGQAKARNAPLEQSATVSVGSKHTAPVAKAAPVPAQKKLEFARDYNFFASHGLGTTELTLHSIDSFVGTGYTDRLKFSSLEDATNAHLPAVQVEDQTVPRDTHHKKVYVWLLCLAMQSLPFAVDIKLSDTGSFELPQGFNKAMKQTSVVELCAWQMLERMIQRHTADGVRLFGNPKQWPTFLDRFNAVMMLLLQRKGASKRVMEFPFIDQITDDPATVLNRIISNENTNLRKKHQIAAGQQVLAEQEANGEAPVTAKKPRASRKRKGSDDDAPEGPASKQART